MFRYTIRSLSGCIHKINSSNHCPIKSIYKTSFARNLHCSLCLLFPRGTPKNNIGGLSRKYEVIDETNAHIIENNFEENPLFSKAEIVGDYDDINLQRGETGVFDIENLVNVLQRENAKDIFVATVPKDIHYVDHICIVSGRSKRHLLALAMFVRKVYKMKCNQSDVIPKIEGRNSQEWLALDLGNIALHIFSEKARQLYDLETLWAVGSEYDDQANEKDGDIVELLHSFSSYIGDLKPRNDS